VAQFGGKHPNAKPWKGEGTGIFEVVDDHRGDTYRAVYTVRFEMPSRRSHLAESRRARTDVQIVTQRLKLAKQGYEARHGKAKK
jgi:phage-related protein